MTTWLIRALVLVLLLETTGCSWWRNRREARAEREAAAVAAVAPATGTPAAATDPQPANAADASSSATIPETASEPASDGTTAAAPPTAIAALAPADAQAARRLAADFYEMHGRFAGRGLLDPSAMNAYGAFLCPSLVRALDDARASQAAFRAARPDEKAPLSDGDLFSSLFEGVEHAEAGIPVMEGGAVRVPMSLRRSVGPGAQRWQDALVLQRDGEVWCVADVDYGGGWTSANRGRLTDNLKSAFE